MLVQFLVYILNNILIRKGYETITLKQHQEDSPRDHEFSGWYGYLRKEEARISSEPDIHRVAEYGEGESYYELSMAFAIQDRIINSPVCLPLKSAITMVTTAMKTRNFIEELARDCEQLVNDFKAEQKAREKQLMIRTSFPGQKHQEVPAPDHIVDHFKKSKDKLPFIEVIWN